MAKLCSGFDSSGLNDWDCDYGMRWSPRIRSVSDLHLSKLRRIIVSIINENEEHFRKSSAQKNSRMSNHGQKLSDDKLEHRVDEDVRKNQKTGGN